MQILKQSTAASIVVGPVLDSTGAAYTGAAIGDFTLSKNGTSAALAAAATATHDANGVYILALTTGNTDTLGRADIYCNKATYAMGPARFEVLSAATFNALVTNAAGTAGGLPLSLASAKVTAVLAATDVTGNVAADVQTVKTQAVTCAAGVTVGAFVGNAGALQATDASGRVILQPTQTGVTIPTVTTVSNAVTLPSIPANWITAAGINAAALNGKGDWLAPTVAGRTLDVSAGGEAGVDWANVGSPTTTLNLSGTTVKTLTDAVTLPSIPANWITAAGIATDADTEIAAAVWDLATSGHSTAGTFGEAMAAAGSAGDPWTTAVPGTYSAGQAGYILGNKIAATLDPADVSGNLAVDIQTIKTQAVTGPVEGSGVAIGAFVGNATRALAVDANGRVGIGNIAGTAAYPYDGVMQSATSTTVTFPATDAQGNAIPDDTRYEYESMGIVGGTGMGQTILLTTRTGTRTYGVLSGTMSVTCDGTSQYVLNGTWRAHALLAATDVTGNLPVDLQTVKTQVVTCGAGVTVGAYVGNAGALQATDASGRVILQPTQSGVTIPTVTTLTNLPAVTTDWLTAAGVKADAVTKIQAGLATPTNITAGTITTATNLTNTANVATASAAAILASPANKLATASDGSVTAGLKADAMDAITDGELSGAPSNFREKLLWVFQRLAGRVAKTLSDGSGSIVVKTAAGATVTTQSITDNGAGDQTQGDIA